MIDVIVEIRVFALYRHFQVKNLLRRRGCLMFEDLEMLMVKSKHVFERTSESQCAFKNFQSTNTSTRKYFQSTSTFLQF